MHVAIVFRFAIVVQDVQTVQLFVKVVLNNAKTVQVKYALIVTIV